MKFNSDLSHYQNLRAWREYFFSSPKTDYALLNESEKAWLRAFNESLRQLEDKFYPIMDAKHKKLQARVADPADWLMEFNLDCLITFYLREDDPEYEEDDDNILMEIVEMHLEKSPLRQDWGFGATHMGHAESVQNFSGECHCYLYHQLYDHCGMDWRDLFRIGDLYVEIKIDEQSGMLPVIQYEKT